MVKSYVAKHTTGSPTDEDMALINKYSLRELQKDEIFCFSVILCDNDIDRDFECFDEDALKSLERLLWVKRVFSTTV